MSFTPVKNITSYSSVGVHDGHDRDTSPSKQSARHSPWRRAWDRMGAWWVLELICVLVSIACLFGIVAIGVYMNGQPLDHWQSPISPNAMLSTLTTVSKAAILFAVAASISQLKWCHFEGNPRRLVDIDRFNDASSSPLGAVQFLFKMKASALLASSASLLVIASLLFEPMAQQLLGYRTTPIPNHGVQASIPVGQVYDRGNTYSYSGADYQADVSGFSVDDQLQIAAIDGFFGSSDGKTPTSMQIPIDCPSGNCTFPSFTTLGVCSSCASSGPTGVSGLHGLNLTGDCAASEANETCTYTTEAGNTASVFTMYAQGQGPATVILNSTARFTSAGANGEFAPTDLLASFLVVRMNTTSPYPPDVFGPPGWTFNYLPLQLKDAWECSLTWCAQTFENVSSSSSQTVSETPVKSWPLKLATGPPKAAGDPLPNGTYAYTYKNSSAGYDVDFGEFGSFTYVEYVIAEDTGDMVENKTFTVSIGDMYQIQSYLQVLMTVSQSSPAGFFNNILLGKPEVTSIDISGPLWNNENISEVVSHVAVSMGNAIRQTSNSTVCGNTKAAPTSVLGTTLVTTTIVQIEWAWITLPAIVVVCGGLILIASIVTAGHSRSPTGHRNVPLWKGSNIGILSHGYDWREMLDEHKFNVDSKQQVKDWARATHVQLVRDGEGHMRFRAVGSGGIVSVSDTGEYPE